MPHEAPKAGTIFHYGRDILVQLFSRPLVCSSEIYFVAPQDMLKAELQTLAAQRFLTWQARHDESAMLDFAEYIPAGQRMHLSGYLELHKAHIAQATSRTPGKAKRLRVLAAATMATWGKVE